MAARKRHCQLAYSHWVYIHSGSLAAERRSLGSAAEARLEAGQSLDRVAPALDRSVLDSLTLDFDRLGFGKPELELARRARLAFPRLAPGGPIAAHKDCLMTARFAAALVPLAEPKSRV